MQTSYFLHNLYNIVYWESSQNGESFCNANQLLQNDWGVIIQWLGESLCNTTGCCKLTGELIFRGVHLKRDTCTWSRAPGKQFGILGRWRDRHTRPARWSDTLRIRPVRWRKWNRIRIDLARLADPIGQHGFRHFLVAKQAPSSKKKNIEI